MRNLEVTAWLSSAIAVYDDWSPDLAGLIEWLVLDRHGMTSPNPTSQQIAENRAIVEAEMPLRLGHVATGDWYWQCSYPCYTYQNEQTDRFRKRWSPGTDTPSPAWGKRRALINTQAGAEKSYDLPLYLRSTERVDWYCVGDRDRLLELLQNCTGLGKKRSIGHGQVLRWDVREVKEDWHLLRGRQLMRAIPLSSLPEGTQNYSVRYWGWRPPAREAANRTLCAVPTGCVQQVQQCLA